MTSLGSLKVVKIRLAVGTSTQARYNIVKMAMKMCFQCLYFNLADLPDVLRSLLIYQLSNSVSSRLFLDRCCK